ncbi:MAG: ABC-type transport auxiliary lipoprotein family protein [Alphaproteobacteria bacterium]
MKKVALIVLATLALTACSGTSPEPDYFSLAPVPGTPSPDIAVVIKIHRPTMPGYLDRLDFIRQDGDYQLLIDNTDNWVDPLDEMFAHTLTADLQQRLPASMVVAEDAASPPNIRLTIDMNIQRFNQENSGDVVLQGELIISDKTTLASPHLIPIHLTADADTSPQSVARGLSQLVADLSTTITQDIEKLYAKP